MTGILFGAMRMCAMVSMGAQDFEYLKQHFSLSQPPSRSAEGPGRHQGYQKIWPDSGGTEGHLPERILLDKETRVKVSGDCWEAQSNPDFGPVLCRVNTNS